MCGCCQRLKLERCYHSGPKVKGARLETYHGLSKGEYNIFVDNYDLQGNETGQTLTEARHLSDSRVSGGEGAIRQRFEANTPRGPTRPD